MLLFVSGELGMMERVMRSIVIATIVAFAIGEVGVEHASVLADDPAAGEPFVVQPVPMLDPNQNWYKPYLATAVLVPSDRATHAAFLDKFEDMSTILSRKRNTQALGRWILSKQQLELPPEYWILVEILAAVEQGGLAFRVDNLYLSGFANSTGHWHAFKDVKDILGATPLEFSTSYTDLVKGAENLVQLELGGDALSNAFQVLLHNGAVADDDVIMRAAATVIVMVSESARFRRIRDAILEGWETGVYLTLDQVKLIVNWTTASCAMILSEQQGGKWDNKDARKLKKCSINTAQEAKDSLSILVSPSPGRCSEDITI